MPSPAAISAIVRYIDHWQPGISIELTGGGTVAIVVRSGLKEAVLRYGAELDDLGRALKGREDALGESLSHLKAAALLWIMELEEQSRSSASPRLKTARSVRLFELLEGFWDQQPWNRIPLPPIAREYSTQ